MNAEPGGLTRVALRGLGWSWLAIAATTVLQFGYTVVMSRLLSPRDFGLMAAALLGLRFVTYLSRFGIGSAVVQRPTLSEGERNVAFTLSVLIGALAALAAVLLSPLIADLVRQPDVVPLMRWLALGMVIGGVSAVPEALIRRGLGFKLLGLTQVLSYVVGYLIVGIPLAVAGLGAGSLVAAALAQGMALVVMQVVGSRFRARFAFDKQIARSLLSFGGLVAATGFLEFLTMSLDSLAVGRWVGTTGLGQYSRATYLVATPVEQATTATSRVMLPTFARVQDDSHRFARGLTSSFGLTAVLISVPVFMASAAAPSLVRVVLGPGWAAAAAVLPWVACAHGVSMLTHLPAVATEAKGLIGRKFLIQLVVLALLVALIAATVRKGPSLRGFALCWLLSEVLRFGLYVCCVIPGLGVRRREILRRLASAAVLGLFAALPVWWSVRHLERENFLWLAASSVAGLGLAAGLFLLFPRSAVRADLEMVRSRARG